MEPVIQTFRTALGGFNRRDVQQYLEQTAADHKKEVAALKEQLDQAREREAALETAMSGLESEKGSAAASEAQIRASLEDSTRTLSKLRGEQSQTESKLAVARKELERLQAQVGELAPMAESYAQLKDRVATVELDAHRKAQDTLAEAQREAAQLREETRRWLEEVLAQYDALSQGMNALLEQARNMGLLEERARALDEQAQRLREMSPQETAT